MKKAKPRTGTTSSKGRAPANSAERKPELAELRRQITDRVGNSALSMVETTIGEVENGHYLGMKYLFEMIGLYPAASTDDLPSPDTMAAVLLRRLGLPETPLPEPRVTKDSGTASANSADGLK